MSDPVEVYQRVVRRFTELVDGITAEQWAADTPCEGWTVRDLMDHVVVRDRRISATVGGGTPEPLAPDADLVEAWHERVDWWSDGLSDPNRRDVSYETPL